MSEEDDFDFGIVVPGRSNRAPRVRPVTGERDREIARISTTWVPTEAQQKEHEKMRFQCRQCCDLELVSICRYLLRESPLPELQPPEFSPAVTLTWTLREVAELLKTEAHRK